MNGQDWDLCRNRLIQRGITDFTDGDVMNEFHTLCNEREREKIEAVKVIEATPVEVKQEEVVVAFEKPKKKGVGRSIA